LLADIQRLSVVAVVFLYDVTVLLQQNTTASLLELSYNDPMQAVYGASYARRRRRWQSTKRGHRLGRCSIYRHRISDGIRILCRDSILVFVSG